MWKILVDSYDVTKWKKINTRLHTSQIYISLFSIQDKVGFVISNESKKAVLQPTVHVDYNSIHFVFHIWSIQKKGKKAHTFLLQYFHLVRAGVTARTYQVMKDATEAEM